MGVSVNPPGQPPHTIPQNLTAMATSRAGATTCQSCGPGLVDHDADAATACVQCPSGRYSNNHTAVVTCSGVCAAGHFAPPQSMSVAACTPCALGRIDHDRDPGTPCVACNAGKYANTTAMTACLHCLPGTHSPAIGATKSATCVECAAGWNDADSSPATPCVQCPSGRYSNRKGVANCTGQCSAGTYSRYAPVQYPYTGSIPLHLFNTLTLDAYRPNTGPDRKWQPTA